MDTIQVIFGNLLLLLAELAVISLAVIVLLLQASFILRLCERLRQSRRLRDLDSRPSRKSRASEAYLAGVPEEKED